MRVDLAAYTVQLHGPNEAGYYATIYELPGCIAAAKTVAEVYERLQVAVLVYFNEHPDAPQYYERPHGADKAPHAR